MKIIFAGSPSFSVPVLQALAKEHNVCLVITQPDKPSGRGKKITEPPVKTAAKMLNIPTHQPIKINCNESKALISWSSAHMVSLYQKIFYTCVNMMRGTSMHRYFLGGEALRLSSMLSIMVISSAASPL